MGWFDGLSGFEWIVVIQLGLVILYLMDGKLVKRRQNELQNSIWREHEEYLKDISGRVGYISRQMDELHSYGGLIKDKLYGHDKL
jgi:hypothetical protein